MEIITVANQKGGCGKTITAVNLAGALAGAGKKVLFIDLDPQTHATSALGVSIKNSEESSYAIFDSFLNNDMRDLKYLWQHRYENLWAIGSHLALSTMEQKMADKKDGILVISKALKLGRISDVDYVVIDTPPTLGFLTLNAMLAATRLIVPLDISLFSLNGVTQIKNILAISEELGFRKPDVNFLITAFDGRSNFAKNFLEKAKVTFAGQLFGTVIRANIKLREAALLGKLIFEYAPYANGAKDYAGLAKEIEPALKSEAIDLKPPVEEDLSVPSIEPQVSFKFHAPAAASVYITGTFNNWTLDDAYRMESDGNGSWVKKLYLPAGRHLYKFVVDGAWKEDPENKMAENDAMGGSNSVILVG